MNHLHGIGALGAAFALTAGLADCAPPAPSAPVGPATIVATESGKCLDVDGNRKEPRTRIDVYECVDQANQQWVHTPDRELTVFDDQTCLDVRGKDTTAPAVAQIFGCGVQPNQQWYLNDDGTITGAQSGLCLSVLDEKNGHGSNRVGLEDCNGAPAQQWTTSLRSGPETPDTEAPGQPANPRTSDLTCDAVTFTWDAASDDVGVTGYDLYHDGQFISSVDGDTLSDRVVVESGTRWGLYVNARDAAGNVSRSSDSVVITPPPCDDDTEAPTAPTDLDASVNGTSVELSWTAATDDVGVRAYDIRRDGRRVGSVTGTATRPPVTEFTDDGLDGDTTYRYAVVARDAQGNRSRPSGAAEVTTGASCDGVVCSVDEIATDTDIPWGLATLPDGSVLYTRRDAHDIVRLDPGTGQQTSIGTVPNVQGTDGEGGLTGLAISDDFASDRWLYLMHSTPGDPGDNRVVRIRYEGGELQTDTEEILLTGIERSKFHDGGRLRFGPDGKLYVATGDAENEDSAQDLDSLNGKILRIDPDGAIPDDNPFGTAVWSYGHRNPQGLAFDSQGRLWQQEFGNSRMDETNLVVKGGNYGWPECEGTLGGCDDPDFVAPKATYPNDQASCSGITVVDDALYVACLRGERMYRHVIDGDELTDRRSFFTGSYGRLRTVEEAPGGNLWLTTSNEGDKDSVANNSDTQILRVVLGD